MPEGELIGTQISNKLLREGKKQTELSKEISVCERTVRKLQKSEANPSLKLLKRIAASMGKSISSFLNLIPSLEANLCANCKENDPQDVSAEIDTLSLWIQVFLRISEESQQSFSEHSGVCLDTVHRLKQKWSSCNPTLSTLQSFAAYMSVTVSELLDTTLSEADMEKLLEERLHLPKHALSKVPDDKDLPESV